MNSKQKLTNKCFIIEKDNDISIVKVLEESFRTEREIFYKVEVINSIDLKIKRNKVMKLDISKIKELSKERYANIRQLVSKKIEKEQKLKEVFENLK